VLSTAWRGQIDLLCGLQDEFRWTGPFYLVWQVCHKVRCICFFTILIRRRGLTRIDQFRSAAKLAYSNAQAAIESGKLPEHVKIHDEHDPEGIASDIKQLDVGSPLLLFPVRQFG
jgi:hypothetical protein